MALGNEYSNITITDIPEDVLKDPKTNAVSSPIGKEMDRQVSKKGVNPNSNEKFELPTGTKVSFVLKNIDPNKTRVFAGNPRGQQHLDDAALKDILPSIRLRGITDPVIARPVVDGSSCEYEIIEGSRRRAAAILTGKILPALIAVISDSDAHQITAIGNIYKKPCVYELGIHFLSLDKNKENPFSDVEDVCNSFGVSESSYFKSKRIGSLPDCVVNAFERVEDIKLDSGAELASAIKNYLKTTGNKELLKKYCQSKDWGKFYFIDKVDGPVENNSGNKIAESIIKWLNKKEKVEKVSKKIKVSDLKLSSGRAKKFKNVDGEEMVKITMTNDNTLKMEFLSEDERDHNRMINKLWKDLNLEIQ